jgi:hypothetical protein
MRSTQAEAILKKFFSGLLAAGLAASFAISAASPLNAAPVFLPKPREVRPDVENVQYGPEWRRMQRNREWRRLDRRLDRRSDARMYRRGGVYYYNGHRGYRDYRPGYRRYNDWWFPAGAFIAGAIVGGAIANSNPPRAYGGDHVQWCYDRYRSYRASDNTYQPYGGPRQQCISPYS